MPHMLRTSVLAALLFTAGCSEKSDTPASRGAGGPVPVKVAEAVKKTMPVELRTIGNVEPVSTVIVKPQVNGELAQVHFEEGQDVKQGDLLFTVDPRPFEAALAQAEGTLERSQAQLKNAEEQLERYTTLSQSGAVAKEQFEHIRANAQSLRASMRAEQAAVENARLQLEFCSIRAPISGRAGDLKVNAGNVVKLNETELVTINQIAPIDVSFALPEQHLGDVQKFQSEAKLQTVASGRGGRSAIGELSFIDNAVDAATGTIRLKATFTNEDRALWPGEFVNVTLRLRSEPDAVVVPTAAVQASQKGQTIYIVKQDGTAELRPVTVRFAVEQESVVDGVRPGERVVTDGQLRITPGAKVQVQG